MTKELKANAQSQRSEIGGGRYGYLPLVISEPGFLSLPTTETVVFPAAPAPFTVRAGTTQVKSMIQNSQRETESKAYLEYAQMHLALKTHLTSH